MAFVPGGRGSDGGCCIGSGFGGGGGFGVGGDRGDGSAGGGSGGSQWMVETACFDSFLDF